MRLAALPIAALLPAAAAGEAASDPGIGTSILRHFIVTTDFSHQAIWLEPRR
jgi:hypothetical protein